MSNKFNDTDELAKQVAEALLGHIHNPPKKERVRSSKHVKPIVQKSAQSNESHKSESIAEEIPNKFETCIPLISGGTPLGTPLVTASAGDADGSGKGTGGSATDLLSQYMNATSTTRSRSTTTLSNPLPPQNGGRSFEEGEYQQLIRLIEEEKRKNRKITQAFSALEREVSLFRSRKQIFVSIVAFKLFNPRFGKDVASEPSMTSVVGSDEHVEYFIVVDKSTVPKYLVRHRFNHFKILHRLLESGSFRVTRPVSVFHSSTYYDGLQQHESSCASTESDSEGSEDVSPIGTSNRTKLPNSLKLSMSCEMMPSLPSKDRRNGTMGDILTKITKKIGSREKEPPSHFKEQSERSRLKELRRLERSEKEAQYRAYLCSVTGINEKDLSFLERRAKELEIYLRQLLTIDLFSESDVMSSFLTPDHSLFQESSLRDSKKSDSESLLTARADSQHFNSSGPFLAPPMSHTGRLSPGGDLIVPTANLAILLGEPIPCSQVHSELSTGHSPVATPYVSQNLPSQTAIQQSASFHQSGTGSGPLDVSLNFNQNISQKTPNNMLGRNEKKPVVSMFGGRTSQHLAQDSGSIRAAQSTFKRIEQPSTILTGYSPVPMTPVSQFFSSGANGEFINPNVEAFKTLVILPDDKRRFPSLLGGDAIEDYKEVSLQKRGFTVPEKRPKSEASEAQKLLPKHISQNENFTLLLSSLGFGNTFYSPGCFSGLGFESQKTVYGNCIDSFQTDSTKNLHSKPFDSDRSQKAAIASQLFPTDLPQPCLSGPLESQ